ncbi:hypothetical protein BT67DRAFT_155723 [Trichocladium antarcticum]|uniref:Uncharacterized protein n=1 Tax=Trichocladium antarcticum TaxID=1450529 RepID=A0AAN6UEY7_9PEZI|nr:hypothetical protein BT67DRAFT_155723 [Trichocladium antarcticum]
MVLPTREPAAHSCLQQSREVMLRQPPYIKTQTSSSSSSMSPNQQAVPDQPSIMHLLTKLTRHPHCLPVPSNISHHIHPWLAVTSPSRIPSICTEYEESLHPSHLPSVARPSPAQPRQTQPPTPFLPTVLIICSFPSLATTRIPPFFLQTADWSAGWMLAAVVYNSPAYSRH